MEAAKVPKSFGWFSQKGLMLRLNSFRSKSNNSSNSNSPTLMSPRSPMTAKRNRENEFKQVFARFDGDKDGKISALELRSYFGSIGEYMSHEEAEGVIDELDRDGDGLVDFKDFMGLMRVDNNGGEEREDMKAAFEMFEYEKGCGMISPKSLQKTLSRLGESKSYDECLQMIKVFDSHGKGAVDFNEFQQMMMA